MIPLLKLVSVPFLLVRWSLRREHPRKKMSEGRGGGKQFMGDGSYNTDPELK